MQQPARMATAFAVAIGLHLMAFQLWPQPIPLQLNIQNTSSLQVELVKSVSEKQSRPSETRQARHQPESIEKPDVMPAVQVKQVAPSIPTEQLRQASGAHEEAIRVAYEEAPEQAIETEPIPGAMPVDVQQMILTRISYPRQARRKGWEGRATFHLAVSEQKLTRLDIFLSSGFALLDRAAMRGIQDVKRLPLANGLYSLPVEFRLQ